MGTSSTKYEKNTEMGKKLGQQLLMATKKYRELGRASTIVPDGHLLFHYGITCILHCFPH